MTTHIVASERDVDLIALVLKAQAQKGRLSVEIKPYVENRRRRQENLYRSWCAKIAAETGNDPEVIHKYLAKRYVGTEIISVNITENGQRKVEEHEIIRSTTTLSVREMSHYMSQIQEFAADYGIFLPAPPDE